MGRDYERNPVASILRIEGFWFAKVGHFLRWRDVLIEMTGSQLRTVLRDRPLDDASKFGRTETVGLFEVERTDPDWGVPVTPERRRGIWAETPEEPLWILFYLTVPGGVFYARHAAALAQRLEEVDEVVHFLGGGGTLGWRDFFVEQAKSGLDIGTTAEFETVGEIRFDLSVVDRG